MKAYKAQLFDDGFDAGTTTVNGRTPESAWNKAVDWARKGDWHSTGSVNLTLTAVGEEEPVFNESITVYRNE